MICTGNVGIGTTSASTGTTSASTRLHLNDATNDVVLYSRTSG